MSRPVVGFSLGKEFNDVVALDLKFINAWIILHMIDTTARYSQAGIVKRKTKEDIAEQILKHWIAIFGPPKNIFSDGGGEFNNHLLREVAELFNINVLSTAMEVALMWSISAKNALHNHLGFSPNQLVFGYNPNLPSNLINNLPALRDVTPSKLIADHLNSLHAARRAFTQSESSKKIKKALRHQTRTSTSKSFTIGDKVYYKRNNEKQWRGPAKVVGIDGKVVVVRHGGSVVTA